MLFAVIVENCDNHTLERSLVEELEGCKAEQQLLDWIVEKLLDSWLVERL